jgi:hypothetical protein
MEDTTTSPTTRNERSESRGARTIGRLGGAVRRSRSTGWPPEVSSGVRGVWTSNRTLTGLHALGLPCEGIRFEIRSRKAAGVWVMAHGLGNAIAHGRTLTEATAALLRILAPDVER